jgi:uncharacterized membrane protein YphA (DoxX/SURF4 family)
MNTKTTSHRASSASTFAGQANEDPPTASDSPAARSFARYLPMAARLLLGLIFFVFGLNGFLNFIPPPREPMPSGAAAFIGALVNSGYLLRLVAGTQVLVGALLLSNRFVPLALALIAPVVVNIVAFHLFLAPSGVSIALVVLALEAYLAWVYRRAFRPMLAARTLLG